MTPKERVALLQKLAAGVGVIPTDEAREAIRYLKSMERYQPKTLIRDYGDKNFRINNPVVGTIAQGRTSGPAIEIGFSTDTGMDRPTGGRSRLQTQAIKAVNAQLLDSLPSAKNPDPNAPSFINLSAITDAKDVRLSRERGRPVNQRASAYKHFTSGAFQPYPSKNPVTLDWDASTEKIGPTTWQPKDSKGRFMKYVQWDPKDALKPLATAAGRRVLQGFPLTQAFATILEADSIIEGVTGHSPIKTIAGVAEDNIKKGLVPKPITLIKPPF